MKQPFAVGCGTFVISACHALRFVAEGAAYAVAAEPPTATSNASVDTQVNLRVAPRVRAKSPIADPFASRQ
ncbi:hypothetical protein [Micromonospora sp. AKA38]|uniref:hypothetical protein n=1 Tax=Micromonospora sp. AKA38 TaxID=2733861 RepID=UPI0022BCC219|nr:hypothetical protein [Micromonospora sp. AKA38]GHJ15296.1 hypothetical protein TPA0908_32910 [Micromonospora sp. AKA38]